MIWQTYQNSKYRLWLCDSSGNETHEINYNSLTFKKEFRHNKNELNFDLSYYIDEKQTLNPTYNLIDANSSILLEIYDSGDTILHKEYFSASTPTSEFSDGISKKSVQAMSESNTFFAGQRLRGYDDVKLLYSTTSSDTLIGYMLGQIYNIYTIGEFNTSL